MLTMPIVFLFYREHGLGTSDLFILRAVYSLAIVILEVPSGYIGDVFGRKNSLIIGSVMGFLGFFLYCFSDGFWSFLVCEVVLGIGQSFISGSDSAMVYDTLLDAGRQKEYLKIEGRLISVGNFAEAAAAPIGVLLAVISLRTTYYCQALVAFAAIPAALLLYEPARKEMTGKPGFLHIMTIFRYALVDNRELKWKIVFSSIMGVATLTMAWFVQPYFVFLSLPLAYYGIVIPLLNLTAGSVAMHAYKIEGLLGQNRTMVYIAAAIAGGYICLGSFYSLWPVLFVFYLFRGLATPILRNYINESTPSEMRATVLSIRNLIIRLMFAGLGPVLGWQADRAGVPSALLAGGALFLVSGLLSVVVLINMSNHRLAEQQQRS